MTSLFPSSSSSSSSLQLPKSSSTSSQLPLSSSSCLPIITTQSQTKSSSSSSQKKGLDKVKILMKLDKLCYTINDSNNDVNVDDKKQSSYVPSISFIEFCRINISDIVAKEIADIVDDLINNDNNNDDDDDNNDITIKNLKRYRRLIKRGSYTSIAFQKDTAVQYIKLKINIINSDVDESIEQLESMLQMVSNIIIDIDKLTKPDIALSKKNTVNSNKNEDNKDYNDIINNMSDIEHEILTVINNKKANKMLPGSIQKIEQRFYKFKNVFNDKTNEIYEKINECKNHAEISNMCSNKLDARTLLSIKSLIHNFRYIEKLFISLQKDNMIIYTDPVMDIEFTIPIKPKAQESLKPGEENNSKSAIIIQKSIRGKQAKKKVDDLKKSKMQVEDEEEIIVIKESIIPVSTNLPSGETKQSIAETKSTIAETKQSIAETKSTIAETKPTIAETKQSRAEIKPTIAETKPTIAETKPTIAETKVTSELKSKP